MPTELPKVTATIQPGLKAAAEQRAQAEGRSLSDLMNAALAAYLRQPVRHRSADDLAAASASPMPRPGVPARPFAPPPRPSPAPAQSADPDLLAELRRQTESNNRLAEALNRALPAIVEAAAGYQDLQAQIDDITVAIGRRRGAALALAEAETKGRG